jgi:hypothetical protein
MDENPEFIAVQIPIHLIGNCVMVGDIHGLCRIYVMVRDIHGLCRIYVISYSSKLNKEENFE